MPDRRTILQAGVRALALSSPPFLMSCSRVRAVDIRSFGAVGDGLADDSRAIQAAIDATRGGEVVFPAGFVFRAAGLVLSGDRYDGTTIRIDGTLKLVPSRGRANWDATGSPSFSGLTLHDVEGVTIDVSGWIDGARQDQSPWQQHHCLQIRGARKVRIPRFRAREVRGDGIVISSRTNVAPLLDGHNSEDIWIGDVEVRNTDHDGRNALSIISADRVTCGSIVSRGVGGMIAGERMPGGVDIEPDGQWHRVRDVRIGLIDVETVGTSGVAVLGSPVGPDGRRNVENVEISKFMLRQVGEDGNGGGAVFRGVTRLKATGTAHVSGGASAITIDDALDVQADFTDLRSDGIGLEVGRSGWVVGATISARIERYAGAGLLAAGMRRSSLRGQTRGPSRSGSIGVQISAGNRDRIAQEAVLYGIDVPYDPLNSFGLASARNVRFDPACVVRDCRFVGYPSQETQFGLDSPLRSIHVAGRTEAASMPQIGQWSTGDFVANVGDDGPSGWIRLTDGKTNRPLVDWRPVE